LNVTQVRCIFGPASWRCDVVRPLLKATLKTETLALRHPHRNQVGGGHWLTIRNAEYGR